MLTKAEVVVLANLLAGQLRLPVQLDELLHYLPSSIFPHSTS
jgi:hypothetical protein